jgi:hypothetical protein
MVHDRQRSGKAFSHLMNGHFSRFTTDKLLGFLKRLDRKVTIQVSRHHKGEPYQQVTFAP